MINSGILSLGKTFTSRLSSLFSKSKYGLFLLEKSAGSGRHIRIGTVSILMPVQWFDKLTMSEVIVKCGAPFKETLRFKSLKTDLEETSVSSLDVEMGWRRPRTRFFLTRSDFPFLRPRADGDDTTLNYASYFLSK
jgi:hypothetical protein